MYELIIPPTQITFIATNKCTAACRNCCFQCSPKNKDRLTLAEMKQYIDHSTNAYDTIKLLIMTGGECFTLGKDLNQVIKYASNNGLLTRVVTNGYWAKSLEKAHLMLKTLVEAGLTEINFSTGDEHQTWVPYDTLVNGIVASLELNLTTVVNVESSHASKFGIEYLKTDYRLEKYKHLLNKKLLIFGGAWMPFLKSDEEKINQPNSEISKIFPQLQKKRCTGLFNTISVSPFHQMIACCGLTIGYIKYLWLGNTKKYSLKFLYEYQFQDFLKIWLFTEGPENILKFCRNKLTLPPIDTTNWHICQICVEIFRDEQNILVLQQNYKEVFSNVMLKYSLLRKKYLKSIYYKKLQS